MSDLPGMVVGSIAESLQGVTSATVALPVGLLAVFLGTVVLISTSLLTPRSRRAGVARSLAALEARGSPPSLRERELAVPLAERALDPAMRAVTGLGRRLTPADQVARIRKRLDLAGNPVAWDVDRVVSLKVLLSVVGTSVTLVVCLALGVDGLRTVTVLVLVGTLAWLTPSLIVYQMAYDRSEHILRELPDALDLLTISVESGLGFDAAVGQVARNTEGPLAQELVRVLQEMQIGTGRLDALRGLGERTDVDDLKAFVAAMVQADSYGVPIAAVLRVQADQMRLKRSQRAEEAAQRVPVKILFPLIFGILPALLVVVVGPGIIAAVDAFRRIG